MVRRAILDRAEPLAPDDQVLPPDRLPDDPLRHTQPWQGAGGRWLIWAGRAVVWAVVLLIGYRGVLAIFAGQGEPADTKASAPVSTVTAFPVTLAEAYALQFGQAYLTFSPADSALRARQLAHFLAPGTDPQFGWNGAGTEFVNAEQVAGISVTGAHAAVVTLLATVNNDRMLELAVPIYAAGGGMSVSGTPALLPAPATVAASPASRATAQDQATSAALAGQLPAFFAAYASGDRTTLARFTAPGSHLQSLDGVVSFGRIDSVYAPVGGATRTVTVTVTWMLPRSAAVVHGKAPEPASLQMTYRLTVVRQGSSWDVQGIGPLTGPQGPP